MTKHYVVMTTYDYEGSILNGVFDKLRDAVAFYVPLLADASDHSEVTLTAWSGRKQVAEWRVNSVTGLPFEYKPFEMDPPKSVLWPDLTQAELEAFLERNLSAG